MLSPLKASIALSRVLLILGLFAAPGFIGLSMVPAKGAVLAVLYGVSYAVTVAAFMGLVWLIECDMAVLVAQRGLRPLLFGSRDRARGWAGATALRNLPLLTEYLSAKRRRVIVLLLQQVFFLMGAICNVAFVWLDKG